MKLERLKLYNFKNYAEAEMNFEGSIHCFYGKNASGKTNILDAIHYLGFTKSYFTGGDKPTIRFGEENFSITGRFTTPTGVTENIKVSLKSPGQKKVSRNDKDYQRFSDHIGQFPVVMISPSDSDLINNGSEVRRKYFDSVISQFDATYLENLIRYNKALSHRNRLLKIMKDKRMQNRAQLEVWDQQLMEYAVAIFEKRVEYNKLFSKHHAEMHSRLTDETEIASVEYDSSLMENDMKSLLDESFQSDLQAGFTTKGVHRDDYFFYINEHRARRYASQGQQKSYLLALKMAQYMITNEKTGHKPILLFDDVFDKLDPFRVQMMIKMLCQDPFGQVFITDTHKLRIEDIIGAVSPIQLFKVENGTVKADE
ncbi:MAG: DNA replication and repair protein RecF [Marinilabiliales bacterium]|nr:MAG: DNA replication and repair protein RecF [Marinilabiliales bacterium]